MAGNQQKFQTAMTHADRFSAEGNWTEAMKAYRFALAEFPNNSAAILGFGKAGLSSGNIELAYKAFVQALKINPTNLDALNLMGDVQERTGKLDAASETYLRMGNVYASRNDLDAATDYWMRATKLTSGHVDAHQKLAQGLAQQGKSRMAAREYLTLAAIYQQRGDSTQAGQFVGEAKKLLPDNTGILAAEDALLEGTAIHPDKLSDTPAPSEMRAADFTDDFGTEDDPFGIDELFGEDDTEQMSQSVGGLVDGARHRALEELANLAFEDGDDPSALIVMQAVDLQSRDEQIEALRLYQQAIQAGSSRAALYFNLGLIYREQGQLGEAAEMLKLVLGDENYGAPALFSLGESYYAANDVESSIRNFVEAIAMIDMKTVSGHRSYGLGQTYENLADNILSKHSSEQIATFVATMQNFFSNSRWEEKAYEARQRMNTLAADDDETTMSLAEFLESPETEVMVTTLAATSEYMNQDFLMTASEECLRAIQKVPTFLPLHARLAEIMLKQDNTDNAITKYLYISKVYQMRGQPDQAINVYHKILKLAPMDVTVRSKLIDLYILHSNADGALEQYLTLADSYYQLAQVDRALEKYNEALRLAATTGNGKKWQKMALTRMADIYDQRFDWANATTAYQKLLELNPNDVQLLRQLVELYYKRNQVREAANTLDKLLAIYQRQNPATALALLKELSNSYPDDMSLRERLAVAYVQNSMTREAIAVYDKLGEMQLENGLRDQAIQTIQAIINLGPDDIEGYNRLLGQIS